MVATQIINLENILSRMERINLDSNNLNNNMTDNEYLEMSNHFKELLDKKDKEYKELKKKYDKKQIVIYKVFGMISMMNEDLKNMLDDMGNIGAAFEYNLDFIHEELIQSLNLNI